MVSKMASNEDIIKEAEYYLSHDVTNDEASRALGISKRSFQLHMKKLAAIAPDKYKLVQDKKVAISRQGHVKGGSLGKRGSSFAELEIDEIGSYIIENDLTFQKAAEGLGIAKSTLHELVKKIGDPEKVSLLYALAEAHKRKTTLGEYVEKHNSEHVNSDLVAKEIIESRIAAETKKSK
mgnify:CR=1 FL=1